MDTANALSNLQALGSVPVRRPAMTPAGGEGGGLGGEPPPSGAAEVGGQNQTVGVIGKTEKSDSSGNQGNPDKRQVSEAVKNMNDFLQMVRRTLQFTMDEDSGRMVVQIKDAETHQVIRQIPPENVLKLAKELDKFHGLLFTEKA